jgi:nitroreductase
MDLRELVLTRRTVHNYLPDAVPESLIEEALRLSLWAPNHKLTFPWVYTVIGRKKREQIADLAVELRAAKEMAPLSEVKIKAARDNVLLPSHLVSLGLKTTKDARQAHEDYATLACSVQIMSLHLWRHGVATKWSTGGFYSHPKTYEILGLNPMEVRLEGGLLIGRAQMVPDKPERPDLSSVVRRV